METASKALPTSVAILGSTGSVGCQALDVARHHHIPVDMIGARSSVGKLEEQVREFSPRLVAVSDEKAAADLRVRIADTDTKILAGEQGIIDGISESRAPVAVNAILGEAGLMPTLAVIDSGKRLALANKESLVVAGDEVMRRARERSVEILPVDSEHCAIFQCLQAGKKNEVKRILLTASGGPFFGYDRVRLATVTKKETLAHPTWQMGQKITVDSATLMNKGFELIEAAHLFGVSAENVTVVIQRQSIIHSMVEYIDNTVIAQMSVPDMRDCVQYALTYPTRQPGLTPPLDLFALGRLTFDAPDGESFPLLPLAARAYAAGGALPAVLNAANEEAVAVFLTRDLRLVDIFDVVIATVEEFSAAARVTALPDILSCAREARAVARQRAMAAVR